MVRVEILHWTVFSIKSWVRWSWIGVWVDGQAGPWMGVGAWVVVTGGGGQAGFVGRLSKFFYPKST